MDSTNIDSILMEQMASQSVNSDSVLVEQNQDVSSTEESNSSEDLDSTSSSLPETEHTDQEKEVEKNTENQDKSQDHSIDEYGNPVEKKRLYTEEEMQQRIKERLSRVKNYKQVSSQEEPKYKENTSEEPSEENWMDQLKNVVRSTIEEENTRIAEEQWRAKELIKQMEFEEKFGYGKSKYDDFNKVVAGKPITDTMLMATRNLENPAAFIYAVSKLHPQELDRISREDPYTQAVEIGRLHEKMVKARKTVSNSPVPIETPKGDIGQKLNNTPSIESRIDSYAKQKYRR